MADYDGLVKLLKGVQQAPYWVITAAQAVETLQAALEAKDKEIMRLNTSLRATGEDVSTFPYTKWRVETDREGFRGAGYWTEHSTLEDGEACAAQVGGTLYEVHYPETFNVAIVRRIDNGEA